MKFFAVVLACILPFAVGAQYEKQHSLNLDSSNIDDIYIDCGAGFLEVAGHTGDQIEVSATVFIDSKNKKVVEEILETELRLSLEKKSKRAVLKAFFESNESGWRWLLGKGTANVGRKIDVRVLVPERLYASIDDGSGYIKITDVLGGLRIDDGSGKIAGERIGGDVFIDDGSGDIALYNVDGKVKIDDGSGSIQLQKISNDVSIDDGSDNVEVYDILGSIDVDDGSGNIVLENIGGSVRLNDGSGNIVVHGVQGSVLVDGDGSGNISIQSVHQNVKLRDTGSGSVVVKDVLGEISGLED